MVTQKQKDDIRRLMDRVDELVETPRNQAKLAHWERYRARVPSYQDPEGPMFTMDIGLPTMAKMLGFNVREFFLDTVTHIRYQMEMRIWQQENLEDDTAIGRGVYVSLSNALEASMVGGEVAYPEMLDPVCLYTKPVVESDADLDRLEKPDFYTSGEAPRAHRMYGEAQDLMHELDDDGDWPVGFPGGYHRGVLGLGLVMRGPQQNIIFDTIDRPEFAHRVFRYVTDFLNDYDVQRAKLTGEPVGTIGIGNDEVTIPYVSPRLYEEFLLPYELELAEFHGGLTVWHSCGTTSPLVGLIRRIPNIKQFYTGPWTDVGAVMEAFGDNTPIMIAANTVDDIMSATPEHMVAHVRSLADRCHGAALQIRGGSMNSIHDLKGDVAQFRLWTQLCHRTFRGDGPLGEHHVPSKRLRGGVDDDKMAILG
jgi:hypothetical protein